MFLGLRAVVELVWCAALEIGLYRQAAHRRVLDVLAEHLALSLGAPQPLAAAGWDPIDRQRLRLAHTVLQLSPAQLKVIEAEARTVLADLEG